MSTARRNLVCAWLAVLSAAVAFMAWSEAAQERKVTDFDEINVHRINIVEPDGKPRVIISNRALMAGLYWEGKEYRHHSRDEGGFLFFNDDGDEVGGMGFSSRKEGDHFGASSNLLFDQYKQDQTIGLMYSEQDGKRQAGLRVWDRPDKSLFPAIELSDKLSGAKTDAEREALRGQMKELENEYRDGVAERFYAGKQLGDALVKLADKQGRTRLLLKVSPDGAASIEFLDASGKVTQRIPEK
jgi:hypothetical protein